MNNFQPGNLIVYSGDWTQVLFYIMEIKLIEKNPVYIGMCLYDNQSESSWWDYTVTNKYSNLIQYGDPIYE